MKKPISQRFFSGTSGIQLPVPKYRFPRPYENSSRLVYYASFFNSLEVNSSFYKIPRPATVSRWAESVHDDFRFTFKLWKEITHHKGLDFKTGDIARFFQSINSVGHKMGCVLVQLPPGLGNRFLGQLRRLLLCIQEYNPAEWNIAVEFRNKSWYHDSTYELLDEFSAALVIHDIPGSATPAIAHTTPFIYIRFHGPTGNYRDSYPAEFLTEYATYVRDYLKHGQEVYMYFNNTMGEAFNNLKSIDSFIRTNKK